MEKAGRITVYGRVQGVGFRPTVSRLAFQLGLKGSVRNLGGVVEIIAQGEEAALEKLVQQLQGLEAPAYVESLELEELPLQKLEGFKVAYSKGESKLSHFPADLGICPSCQQELQDEQDRRYGYPYISCAQCGPRYTIMHRLPYDRLNTTMKAMPLCPECSKEFEHLQQRRGRAETISCKSCGPQLYGYVKTGNIVDQPVHCDKGLGILKKKEALEAAQALLQQDKLIMVKSVGGYNLVCRAGSVRAVEQLRALKHRPTKPLAVLCSTLEQAKQLCYINSWEKALLQSAIRPIVLLKPRPEAGAFVAPKVAADCPGLGVFLPPMGLYSLLSKEPLVVTSCNYSGQPIIYKDDEAEAYYREQTGVAGLFAYDREILRPADDAVVKVVKVGDGYRTQVLRRTRGYMPEPLTLEASEEAMAYSLKLPAGVKTANINVLAVGAQLEPGFGLSCENKVYTAQVPGELSELATEQHWQELEADWEKLINIAPQVVVADLHPDYTSTELGARLAKEREIPLLQVQHHQAHALAVMAEHNIKEKCLAVCFDGTGYGSNGAIWGGEFLVCQGEAYDRVAHLEEISMLGGDESMKQAWKSALCYGAALVPELGEKLAKRDNRFSLVKAALAQQVNTINNSSMGRVFDAVAAVLGIAEYSSHQGACPQALEYWAQMALDEGIKPLKLHFTCNSNSTGNIVASTVSLWPELLKVDRKDRKQIAAAALGFHMAVVELVAHLAEKISIAQEIRTVVLAGGCFANRILLEKTVEALLAQNLKVYFNEKVPSGDGGITLGQAYYGIMVNKATLK